MCGRYKSIYYARRVVRLTDLAVDHCRFIVKNSASDLVLSFENDSTSCIALIKQ